MSITVPPAGCNDGHLPLPANATRPTPVSGMSLSSTWTPNSVPCCTRPQWPTDGGTPTRHCPTTRNQSRSLAKVSASAAQLTSLSTSTRGTLFSGLGSGGAHLSGQRDVPPMLVHARGATTPPISGADGLRLVRVAVSEKHLPRSDQREGVPACCWSADLIRTASGPRYAARSRPRLSGGRPERHLKSRPPLTCVSSLP